MNTVTKTAFANLRRNKGRNILTGIAIALTALLIYSILTIGYGSIKLQKAAINTLYPAWHMMYRDVSEDTLKALKMHAAIEKLGERCDLGQTEANDATAILIYLDESGYQLNKIKLQEGSYPVSEEDIVISYNTLKALGLTGRIGDYVEIPYQLYEDEGLGIEYSGKFRICGILPDSEENTDNQPSTILVSQAFLKEQIPVTERSYRIMFRIAHADKMTTDAIDEKGKKIASDFGIEEANVVENSELLMANYVDPAFYTGMIVIILIVVLAGFLTIYSIYYVSLIHKVQEYGKLKALGATKRQIRQIVFREGMLVALLAVPLGLLIGIFISRSCFRYLSDSLSQTNSMSSLMVQMLEEGRVSLLEPWIVAAAIGISMVTVAISLVKPMRKAGKISVIEAMRYENGPVIRKKVRNGYKNLTLLRLTGTNLSRNKKRTAITIITLGATGVLYITIASILNCAEPKEMAREEMLGNYRISIESESGNQMHPERDWKNIQQNNPLNAEFEQQVLQVDGVKKIQKIQEAVVTLDDFIYDNEPWRGSIIGLDEDFAEVLEDGQTSGQVTYDKLLNGDGIILSKRMLFWFPEIKVGDTINITIENGNSNIRRKFIIEAICDCSYAITQGADFVLPTKVIENICSNNMTYSYEITADENDKVEESLKALTKMSDYLVLETYQEKVKMWQNSVEMMAKACYIFIIILAGVGIMNLINTMINSVYTRKRELGIMQAIGMSDGQLIRMLQMEGLFYTLGTLAISLGIGNLAGYSVFLYAKEHHMMNITSYHYPYLQAFLLVIAVFVLEMLLGVVISRSFSRQSVIERIRYSE